MPDREKVIRGLEETEIMLKQAVDRGGEMAVMGAFKCYNHVSDAIAMLKEQEAKIPLIMQDIEGIWSTCPTCGNKLRAILAMEMNTYFPKYCQECGQAVKWE